MAHSMSYRADERDAGLRLDVVCFRHSLYPSRTSAARAIAAGKVFVNGQTANKRYEVRQGDTIVYEVEEEVHPHPLYGEPIDLDIRFEDDDLIVLSKQAGLVCHPSVDHEDGTLVNALIYHCGIDNLCNVQGENDRLGIVHRLDRDTSGLMIAAKNDEAGYQLMNDIRDRNVDRHYLALVHGLIAHDTGMIDAPIARNASDRVRMAVREAPSAREAVTTFQVLERFEGSPSDNGYTLLNCKLFTGRTHQIRVHMQYTGHPVVGDPMYKAHAPKNERASLGLQRQFLHSFSLNFTHPKTQTSMNFVDRLPYDLKYVLDQLKERSKGKTVAGEEVEKLIENV